MSNKMNITGLKYFESKATPITAEEIELSVDGGIVGDYHFGKGDRQVTIGNAAMLEEIAADIDRGLCFRRFKANMVVENFFVKGLKIGSKLYCGDAELEVTGYKECFLDECNLARTKMICPIIAASCFAKVVKSGKVKIGDELRYEA